MTDTTITHQPLLHPAIALDPASVEARHRALVENGTHPMIAEKLANDATTNQEIGNAMKLSLGTVKNYVSSLLLALDVRSRSHVVSLFR